jgi:cardiolipin synthase A/B
LSAAATLALVLGTILTTGLLVLLVINLMPPRRQLARALRMDVGVDDPHFARVIGVMVGPPLLSGQRIETLVNGDRIFPSMLEAIRSARATITLETFIYWSGEIGRTFAEALAERARAGVKVHVLLDWIGCRPMDPALIETMTAAGAEVRHFRRPRWYTLNRLNNRTHRKLLVVDGRIGFTGGVGIADVWLGDARGPNEWRDTHFRVEGPVVAQMQAAFLDNWVEAAGKLPVGPDYFPELEPVGASTAQLFKSAPYSGGEHAELVYRLSIAAARRSILISAAYFVPDDLIIEALVTAAGRGVRVEVVVPSRRTDAPLVRRAARGRYGPLLKAGIRIHEFQPTMFHCKCLIVDGLWVSVGSTNIDSRSFRLNDEANLNVLDRDFAQEQTRLFEHDLGRSREVDLATWRRRPWRERIVEPLVDLVRVQL